MKAQIKLGFAPTRRAMGQDAGVPLSELRADGAPTANAWLMQFQADIADVMVTVPAFQELSAFGAACAAGFSRGIYEPESLYARIGRRSIESAMPEETRERCLRGWKDAVRQALQHD